ncbi:MAG: NADH-quinone oxidoreductase subunit NuoK [Phycisphaerae bacterium]|nr:MAG: NADH-quinone oxidoreductase subunit NuoK [Planctomycetota bacterium]KAB2939394.1 MAG: NADH-quinone oxidoreductase subunit NuoK [Phycisphaerae bacterium]MBE7455044.1 NADH-quinone oxidoreductase subunit NuoK [Planctomycetia bacterium]MCK6464722.1 NADH-quinone oxidoreductase subunit NuoK [Phycisphaerae bacterium]MCL4718943.1 NADH-quinone oxidoreductase subunit NuoK [Phycisphaerae bacterium]
MTIGLTHYLIVSAVLFCAGVFTMATKRNAIGILIGVELVLNSANVNLVAFDRYRAGLMDGQIAALFVIVLAAAEAALAVAICMNFYKNLVTVDVDQGDVLRG